MDPRRAVPSVERVLARLTDVELPHALRAQCARAAVDDARAASEHGEPVDLDSVVADARRRTAALRRQLLQPVVNATGVLLHTNLGRAPISAEALARVTPIVSGYSNLEYRIDDGVRGSRHLHAGASMANACGAEAGLVVNNNAAAVLLVLAALARDRDVIVSRGELVEIGGGFRVPDVMQESGAHLVEVGTTNRTRLADYANARREDTALVLKVHASNYRMTGFVESTPVVELASLGVPVVVDAGSGLLDATTPWLDHRPAWLHDEPGVHQCIDDGAALVTFSGDKLLGGPQAGVIVGRRDLVEQCARHPLARAFRADKLTLALLQDVAMQYLAGDAGTLPFWAMATTPLATLRERAERIAAAVDGTKIVDTTAVPGGGSVPGLGIPSLGVALPLADADGAHTRLRAMNVVARVEHDAIVVDLRTVDPSDDDVLVAALVAVGRPAR
ncbi:MAG TPA: L-seryl-tRNA(Sec) selenium transferase [Acidimicrobiia bacterium]|nr:L-seryl-tRNA(Sec) selenium transferase [Acidimicrobiia bacterium]